MKGRKSRLTLGDLMVFIAICAFELSEIRSYWKLTSLTDNPFAYKIIYCWGRFLAVAFLWGCYVILRTRAPEPEEKTPLIRYLAFWTVYLSVILGLLSHAVIRAILS